MMRECIIFCSPPTMNSSHCHHNRLALAAILWTFLIRISSLLLTGAMHSWLDDIENWMSLVYVYGRMMYVTISARFFRWKCNNRCRKVSCARKLSVSKLHIRKVSVKFNNHKTKYCTLISVDVGVVLMTFSSVFVMFLFCETFSFVAFWKCMQFWFRFNERTGSGTDMGAKIKPVSNINSSGHNLYSSGYKNHTILVMYMTLFNSVFCNHEHFRPTWNL